MNGTYVNIRTSEKLYVLTFLMIVHYRHQTKILMKANEAFLLKHLTTVSEPILFLGVAYTAKDLCRLTH